MVLLENQLLFDAGTKFPFCSTLFPFLEWDVIEELPATVKRDWVFAESLPPRRRNPPPPHHPHHPNFPEIKLKG